MTILLSETHAEAIIFAADRQIVANAEDPDDPRQFVHQRWARKVFPVKRHHGVVGFHGWANVGSPPQDVDKVIEEFIEQDNRYQTYSDFESLLEGLRLRMQHLTQSSRERYPVGLHAAGYVVTKGGVEHPRFYCFRNYNSESGAPRQSDVVDEWWHPRLDFLSKDSDPKLSDPEIHAAATNALLRSGRVDCRFNGDVYSVNRTLLMIESYVRTYTHDLGIPIDSVERIARLAAFKIAVAEAFWVMYASRDPPVAGPVDVVIVEPGKVPRAAVGSPFDVVSSKAVSPPARVV